MQKIKRNRIKCKKCLLIIESKHRHDFKWCGCKSVAVDGGLDYVKVCGYREDFELLTEYETMYKCNQCGATDAEEDLESDELLGDYNCNNCIDGIMEKQADDEQVS